MKHSAVTDETPSAARTLERVVMRRTSDLTPYVANARTHSPEQVAQIARSIQEFGFVNPVLVDGTGGIIAGHGRVLAAQSLDMVEVPTLDVHWLTEAQRRAYVIADNKLALNAGWNVPLLTDELTALLASDMSFDMSALGFDDAELGQLMAPEPPAGGAAQQWGGMPAYKNEDKNAFRSITVHFTDQDGVDSFAALIAQPVSALTKFVWFPAVALNKVADKAWK